MKIQNSLEIFRKTSTENGQSFTETKRQKIFEAYGILDK